MLHELCKGTSTLAQTLSLSSSNALPSLLLQSLIAWRENSPQGKRAVEIEKENEGGGTTWIGRMSGATALVLNKGEAVTGHGQAKICIVLVLLLVKWQHG